MFLMIFYAFYVAQIIQLNSYSDKLSDYQVEYSCRSI